MTASAFLGNLLELHIPEWGHLHKYAQISLILSGELHSPQMALVVRHPPANAGDIRDTGLIPGSRRFPGGGHSNPLQYSCLDNPMNRGAWQAIVHRVAKSQTCMHTLCNRFSRSPHFYWTSYGQPRQHIKKQTRYSANKVLPSQNFGFPSNHVWTWELDYKESWALKNWCFWTVVLEKTLESPLDCKEIQPVHPQGNQYWIFIGKTDAEAETPIL